MNRYQPRHWFLVVALGFMLGLAGCNDSNSRRTPVAPPAPPPPPPNTTVVNADLVAGEVIGGSVETGTAVAALTFNLDDLEVSGDVTLTGVTATAVSLRTGFAGETGAVIVELEEAAADRWSMPANAGITAADVDALDAGSLYLRVDTAAAPSGAIRAQLLNANLVVLFVSMDGAQEVPAVVSSNSAQAAVTFDTNSNALVVHINAVGLDDAAASHVHIAVAGANGGVLIELVQDPNNVAHWFSEAASLDTDGLSAFLAGELYLNLHTPAHPGGEVRGQIAPDGVEVVFRNLVGTDVVPATGSTNTGVAAVTIKTADQDVQINVNLTGLDDATGVTLNQAPAGQNGPEVLSFVQDPSDLFRWNLAEQRFDGGLYAALRNQGLYVTAQTAAFNAGEVRGQLEPAMSTPPVAGSFLLASSTPAATSTVDALPASIELTFNRDVLDSSVSSTSILLAASGGDASFGDGNELAVNIASAAVNGSVVTLDLTGAAGGDEVYQVVVAGTGVTPVTDTAGVVLDGDNDSNPGGDAAFSFTVAAPSTAPTLTDVQTQVFTPSCALSGCHTGASPAQGMNLTAGVAFANIVNVAANEVPSLNRVTPNDADNSFLQQKIEGTQTAGSRMPLGQPALSADLIQLVRDWIEDGAQDN